MASYKVLQDIEAEDTLIGPLTLRQCIYAGIAALAGYLGFVGISKNAPIIAVFMLPFIAFGLFFAFPWSKQQSTEVWALAKIRFYFKPRKRIWNQSGVKQLVTITVPKTIQKSYTSNLSPTEVRSRLRALADTIDSRGWAVKNVDLGYFTHGTMVEPNGGSDRLLDGSTLPQQVSSYDAAGTVDIFDMQNNPVAQKFDNLMAQSAGAHREQLIQQMAVPQPPAGQPLQTTTPQPTSLWHMRTIFPLGSRAQAPAGANLTQPPAARVPITGSSTVPYDLTLPAPVYPAGSVTAATGQQPAVTPAPNPAILELANNNDLNVATIAREAQARNPDPPDEVVVSLH